jgi:hypothetical protein
VCLVGAMEEGMPLLQMMMDDQRLHRNLHRGTARSGLCWMVP